MESVTRTGYGAHLQTCKLLDRPFSVLPNSTLNQKFNLFPEEVPPVNQYPKLGYIGLGNKGATYDMAAGGYLLTTPIPHMATHAAAYNHIPFVVREIDNDLSAGQRMQYRLRVPFAMGGVSYVAYYLRTLSLDTVVPRLELRNVQDGVITSTPYMPSLSELSPVHPVISGTDLNNPNGDYLVSTAKVDFTLNLNDIENIMQACEIIYGDPRFAVINEIVLVSGVDKILSGQFGSVTSNYTEVIAAQVAGFISQHHTLTTSTTEVKIGLNIGSVEPLLT